jgi:Tol biopolymer transport system component
MRKHRLSLRCFPAFVPAAGLLACTADSPTAEGILTEISAQAVARFSEWSEAVNLGPVVNSSFQDFLPHLSSDGVSLYFTSNRPGGMGGSDLWVAQRASHNAAWGEPVNLGSTINTSGVESAPNLSRDGHYLFFSSTRPGGFGSNDIWVSWRERTDDDFAWEPPVNLGPNVNSGAFEAGASLLRPEFYFTSTRESDPNLDIFVSRVVGNTFGPTTRVTELSSADNDQRPSIRFDGLEIFFSSNRESADGTQNIWVATRDGRGLSWSAPVPLGPEINTEFFDQQPSISADGKTLFFSSDRPGGSGGLDLYMATRRIRH